MITLKRLSTLAVLLTILSLSLTATAQEYRRITLPAGYTFVGEVVGTTSAGMQMLIPSGELDIPFDLDPEIAPATAAEMEQQPPLWVVVVDTRSPPDLSDRAEEINTALKQRLRAIPHTRVAGVDSLPAAPREELAGCGQSVGCMLKALEGIGVYHAVVSFVEHDAAGDKLRLISLDVIQQSERARSEMVFERDLDGYHNAILREGYHLLGLKPHDEIPDDEPIGPAVLATAGGDRRSDPGDDGGDDTPDGANLIAAGGNAGDAGTEDVRAGDPVRVTTTPVRIQLSDIERRRKVAVGLAFVPFPGLGVAHMRDPGGFAFNMAADVGAGAGLVYLFGAVSPSAVGFYLPAIAATYAAGVLINQICVAASFSRLKRGLSVSASTRPRVAPLIAPASADGGVVVGFGLSGF
jgi:hypothetical protein